MRWPEKSVRTGKRLKKFIIEKFDVLESFKVKIQEKLRENSRKFEIVNNSIF